MKKAVATVLVAVGLLAQLGLGAVTPVFEDVSAANGLLKTNELDFRIEDNKYWGSTIADINKDGVYDFWLSAHGDNPELYVSKPRGGYQYYDPDLRKKDLHATAAADLDNDGYLDLIINLGGSNGQVVKGYPHVYLSSKGGYRFNRANGRAVGIGDTPFRGRSTSFLDVNGDGCLDLLYVNRPNISMTYAHLLYENQCDGTFRLRNNTGMEEVNAGWHQIVDVNNDSVPDIIFFWYTGVQLWLGTGDFKFVDRTAMIPGVNRMRHTRTVAEIDYDNDGDMDLLFIRTKPDEPEDDILLENRGDRFVDVSAKAGIKRGGRHYHVTTGDLNNDGYTDLYISRTNDPGPRIDDLVMLNNGDKTFSSVRRTGLEIARRQPWSDGDNANIFDYNNDGNADVLVGSRKSAWKLYENVTPPQNRHYILVRVGVPRAQVGWPKWFTRKALGALVKVFCGDQIMMARVGSPGQSHSQSYMDTLHFGLGTCNFVKRIEVHYPHDVIVRRRNVNVDQMVEIGSYFPCPPGKLGKRCDEDMRRCNTRRCKTGDECEVAELVRSKCDQERCRSRPGEGVDLLVNGNFEDGTGWGFLAAEFKDGWRFEGERCVKLRSKYSRIQQNVDLTGKTDYALSCKVLGGPVRFKVFKDGTRIARDPTEASGLIPDSNWKEKSIRFRTDQGGVHRIVFDTLDGISASIDDCSLKVMDNRSIRITAASNWNHLEESPVRQTECKTECLAVYCPI